MHLTKVYDNKRDRFVDAAQFIPQRETSSESDAHITLKEFDRAISKSQNNGASGVMEVPPEAFKCLEGKNKKQVYLFVVDFWEGKADYWQWHIGMGIMVPQKGI